MKLGDICRDFADMGMEYDIVNLLYAVIGGKERGRMQPVILFQYAKEMQRYDIKNME